MNGIMQDGNGNTSSMRAIALMLTVASIAIGCWGIYAGRDAFDIMMVGGMYLGGALTGKLTQKHMERGK